MEGEFCRNFVVGGGIPPPFASTTATQLYHGGFNSVYPTADPDILLRVSKNNAPDDHAKCISYTKRYVEELAIATAMGRVGVGPRVYGWGMTSDRTFWCSMQRISGDGNSLKWVVSALASNHAGGRTQRRRIWRRWEEHIAPSIIHHLLQLGSHGYLPLDIKMANILVDGSDIPCTRLIDFDPALMVQVPEGDIAFFGGVRKILEHFTAMIYANFLYMCRTNTVTTKSPGHERRRVKLLAHRLIRPFMILFAVWGRTGEEATAEFMRALSSSKSAHVTRVLQRNAQKYTRDPKMRAYSYGAKQILSIAGKKRGKIPQVPFCTQLPRSTQEAVDILLPRLTQAMASPRKNLRADEGRAPEGPSSPKPRTHTAIVGLGYA